MNVLFISPGYPAEMADFSRGLARCGARVTGLGEHPAQALPAAVRHALTGYVQVPTLVDTDAVVARVLDHASRSPIERVECLWEPFMTLAAQLREALDIGGMHTAQTELFRDKSKMKRALDAAGLRTPRHTTATGAEAIRAAAASIGLPLVIKPIAGAGSANTHEVRDEEALAAAIAEVGDEQLAGPVGNPWGMPLNGTFAMVILNDEFLHHRGRDPAGADFLPRKLGLVQDRDAQSGIAQRPCEGGTRGSAANDENIKHHCFLRA